MTEQDLIEAIKEQYIPKFGEVHLYTNQDIYYWLAGYTFKSDVSFKTVQSAIEQVKSEILNSSQEEVYYEN